MKARALSDFIKAQHQELATLKAELTGLESALIQLTDSKSKKRKEAKIDFTSPQLRRITNLLQELNYESFIMLRDVFTRYATIMDIDFKGYMDLTQLRLLVSEANLMKYSFHKAKIDLIYSSIRKKGQVNFWKFIKIMKAIGKINYPYYKGQDVLQYIALDLNIPSQRMDAIDTNLQAWRSYYNQPEITALIYANKRLLLHLFKVYAKKRGSSIEIMEFMQMSCDAKIIPKFLSMWEAGRIFRGVQSYECFTDSLVYEEFEECCLCLSIYMMEKEIIPDSSQAFTIFCKMIRENNKTFVAKELTTGGISK